jgi:adenosylcobinamide-GDP ribazoletransferase
MIGADLASAFSLLTRLPLSRGWRVSSMAAGVWAWPVVGAVLGLAGGLVYSLAWHAGLSPLLAGLLAVLTLILLSGGLHEDGLADSADAFGGRTAERRLAIMKDSRIGSFGTLALIASVGLRAAALAQIAEPRLVLVALMVSGIAGRAAMPGVVLLSRPARTEGLAALLGPLSHGRVALGSALALVLGLMLATPRATGLAALAGILMAYVMARFGERRLGGFTGDTLGAAEQSAEIAVLLILAAAP